MTEDKVILVIYIATKSQIRLILSAIIISYSSQLSRLNTDGLDDNKNPSVRMNIASLSLSLFVHRIFAHIYISSIHAPDLIKKSLFEIKAMLFLINTSRHFLLRNHRYVTVNDPWKNYLNRKRWEMVIRACEVCVIVNFTVIVVLIKHWWFHRSFVRFPLSSFYWSSLIICLNNILSKKKKNWQRIIIQKSNRMVRLRRRRIIRWITLTNN